MENNKNNIELPVESQIKKSKFSSFMSTLFGFKRNTNPVENKTSSPIIPIKVDLGSNDRVGQAFLDQSLALSKPMGEKLQKWFDAWMSDSNKYAEIAGRKNRIDQINYAINADPLIGRTVQLYADEGTQIDDQNSLIQIESADPRMTRTMYLLLNQWGVTPTRVWDTFWQLAAYGDAFWANKITDRGVESIYPLQQLDITDRLEFSPVKVLEKEKIRSGGFSSLASNNFLVQQMLDTMNEMDGDFANIFETKLLGFSLDNETVAPPWDITHFRVGSESGRFFPWGTSPILGALAPFKEVSSMMALNNLARQMNFPVTLYKVKTSDSMDEGKQFNIVNRVREAYDNIGIASQLGGSEVYTVNTKIWMPEGLLDVTTNSPNIDVDFKDDIDIREKREAISLALPETFFTGEFYTSGYVSAKSLIQQYKPLRRRVFTLQVAFLQGMADLFRLHFAITGEYDFREPFTLSMRYPADEIDSEINNSRNSSLEMVSNVVELIKGAIGLDDDEGLPPDIVRDIIMKYSFLDPGDVIKWTRDARFKSTPINIENSGNSGGDKGMDFGGNDFGDEDLGSTDLGSEGDSDISNPSSEGPSDINTDVSEPLFNGSITKPRMDPLANESRRDREEQLLREKNWFTILDERKANTPPSIRLREKKLVEKYKESKDALYVRALIENNVKTFQRGDNTVQVFDVVPSSTDIMLETLSKARSNERLRENIRS